MVGRGTLSGASRTPPCENHRRLARRGDAQTLSPVMAAGLNPGQRWRRHNCLPAGRQRGLNAVKGAEVETRRRGAGRGDEFGAAPDVVRHPGGEREVIRVAGDFAFVATEAGDEEREGIGRALDEEIRPGERMPVFGLHAPGRFAQAGGAQGLRHQQMHGAMRGMGIGGVRIKNPARLPAFEDFNQGCRPPLRMGRIVFDGGRGQVRPAMDFEVPAEEGAGAPEFEAAGGAAGGLRAERDGDVDDAGAKLALQPQGQGTGDNLVIGVRRK